MKYQVWFLELDIKTEVASHILKVSFLDDKRLPRRFDFHLQTSAVNFSYLTLMNSHFTYWTNLDLVAFLLNQLYAKKTEEGSGEQKPDEQKASEQKSNKQIPSNEEHTPTLEKQPEIAQKVEQKA